MVSLSPARNRPTVAAVTEAVALPTNPATGQHQNGLGLARETGPASNPPIGAARRGPALDPAVARARLVLMSAYAANGLLLSTWFSRLPSLAARLHIASGELAVVTLALTLATLAAIPIAARQLPTWRATRIVRVTAPLTAVAMLIAVTSVQVWQLVLSLLLLGTLNGIQGVGLNAHATTLSRLADRPFMPAMIGTASAAGVFGGALATLAIAADIPLLMHVGIVTGLCLVSLLSFSRQIPIGGGSSSLRIAREAAHRTARQTARRIERAAPLAREARRHPSTRGGFGSRGRMSPRLIERHRRPSQRASVPGGAAGPVRRDPVMVLLTAAGLGACLAEGGIATFAIVIFRDQLGATLAVATLSFTIFSISMASVRLMGGRLMQRVGARRLLVLGGLLAALCGLSLIARPSLPLAFVALAGIAAGIACAVPVTLHLATEHARRQARNAGLGEEHATARALSRLGLATSGGYLAGGPLMGAVAGIVGLHAALLLIAAGGLALAACAAVLSRLQKPSIPS